MSSKRIVVSLGGNALGYEPEEQLQKVKIVAKIIVELLKEGHQLIITHGNGPQVGLVNLAFEYGSKNDQVPSMPFAECGSMTQGYIGYHLQQCISNELKKNGIDKTCATIVSQVLVDKDDEAFGHPSKPIGTFYTKEEAERLHEKTGYTYIEDAGRGYRRVVASPLPIDIIEKDVIERLVSDAIVICCGGGGIPVIRKDEGYEGIAAVIDKDRTSALLAKTLKADVLLILTAVDSVCLNFNSPQEKKLQDVSVEEMGRYLEEGHFAKGSMLPKVEACLNFLKDSDGEAVITSLDKALDALNGKTGTHIRNR